MAINDDLQDRAIDHAAMLRMYEAGVRRRVDSIIEGHSQRMTTLIREGDLSSTRRLEREIQTEIRRTVAEATGELTPELRDFISREAQFSADSLDNSVGEHFRVRTPPRGELRALVGSLPLMDGNALGKSFENIGNAERRRVSRVIRRGVTGGLTADQIATEVVQGPIRLTRGQARTVVRTAITRYSSVASNLTNKENADVLRGYQYIATLDDRTTQVCSRHDQRVFSLDASYQPMPPLHWNCRSTTVPVVRMFSEWDPDNSRFKRLGAATSSTRASASGQIALTTNYENWLRRQKYSTQLRHFQMDTTRLELWSRGTVPLRRFTNPSGQFVSLSTLTRLDVEATQRLSAEQRNTLQICFNPCFNPKDPDGVDNVTVADINPDNLLNDVDDQARLIAWLQIQTRQNLGLSDARGNTLKEKAASQRLVNRQSPDTDPNNYFYDPELDTYIHKRSVLPDFAVAMREIESIRRNTQVGRGRGRAKRPNETLEDFYDDIFTDGQSLGLTDDQQDFLLNTLQPRLNGQKTVGGNAPSAFSVNQQTTILRAQTNVFRNHNRTEGGLDNLEASLVRQFGDQRALTDIGEAIGNNTARQFRTLQRLDQTGIYNIVSGNYEDLAELAGNLNTIIRTHDDYTPGTLWLPGSIARSDRLGLPRQIRDIDPQEAIQNALDQALRTGVVDRDKIAHNIGREIFRQADTSEIFRDGNELVARQVRAYSRVGRYWLSQIEPDLQRNNQWTRVVVDNYGQRIDDVHGGITAKRTYKFVVEGDDREQLVRTRQIAIARGLGVLDGAPQPEVRLDGKYVNGRKVDDVRTRGTTRDISELKAAQIASADSIESVVDQNFATTYLRLLDVEDSYARNLAQKRGDHNQVATIRFYLDQGYTVNRTSSGLNYGGKAYRTSTKAHESNRAQQTGNSTDTTGENQRPFKDNRIPEDLGVDGWNVIREKLGALISKSDLNVNTTQAWTRTFDDNLPAIQQFGDLWQGASQNRIQGELKNRLERIGVSTPTEALAKLQQHKLFNSISDENLKNEFARAALEVSRIGDVTRLQYADGGVRFRRYQTTLRLEQDASNQGSALISAALRDRELLGLTNVISQGAKIRIYERVAERAQPAIQRRGFDLNLADLTKLQKDNLLTAFYGSSESSRIDRITEGLAELLQMESTFVTTRATQRTLAGSLSRTSRRLESESQTERANGNTDRADELLAQSRQIDTLRDEVNYSLNNGERLETESFNPDLIDDPDAADIIRRIMNQNTDFIGANQLRDIARIMTDALTEELPGGLRYFEGWSRLSGGALRLLNRYSPEPVTSLRAIDFTGDQLELDYAKRVKAVDQYIDDDGVLVRRDFGVTETGVADPGKAAQAHPVKLIFAQDAAIVRQLEAEFPQHGSIFDAWNGPPGTSKPLKERARELYAELYQSDILGDNVRELRQQLIDVTLEDQLTNALREFDSLSEEVFGILDIQDFDQEVFDEIISGSIDDWYGVTF